MSAAPWQCEPQKSVNGCWVYLFLDGRAKRIKIGMSKNVERRMAELGLPELRILWAEERENEREARNLELRLHREFEEYRFCGTEWFRESMTFNRGNAVCEVQSYLDGTRDKRAALRLADKDRRGRARRRKERPAVKRLVLTSQERKTTLKPYGDLSHEDLLAMFEAEKVAREERACWRDLCS